MNLQDLINWINTSQNHILIYFGAILALSFISTLIVNPKNISTIKYLMSALVYAVVVPGILSIFLLLYNILFLNSNILQISIVTYFVPIVAMIFTLFVLNRKVKMSKLPGFTKLSSLFVMISITFFILFFLHRSYFGVFILGSFTHLIALFIGVMIILRIAWAKFNK